VIISMNIVRGIYRRVLSSFPHPQTWLSLRPIHTAQKLPWAQCRAQHWFHSPKKNTDYVAMCFSPHAEKLSDFRTIGTFIPCQTAARSNTAMERSWEERNFKVRPCQIRFWCQEVDCARSSSQPSSPRHALHLPFPMTPDRTAAASVHQARHTCVAQETFLSHCKGPAVPD